jgi:hypothetical protein
MEKVKAVVTATNPDDRERASRRGLEQRRRRRSQRVASRPPARVGAAGSREQAAAGSCEQAAAGWREQAAAGWPSLRSEQSSGHRERRRPRLLVLPAPPQGLPLAGGPPRLLAAALSRLPVASSRHLLILRGCRSQGAHRGCWPPRSAGCPWLQAGREGRARRRGGRRAARQRRRRGARRVRATAAAALEATSRTGAQTMATKIAARGGWGKPRAWRRPARAGEAAAAGAARAA